MRWILFLIPMLLLNGCCETKYITRCPAPVNVPAPNNYLTEQMPETITSADVIKYVVTDLLLCQNSEKQLRIIVDGYKGLKP